MGNGTITLFERIGDWLKDHHLRPYIKARNTADPFGDRARNGDPDYPCDGHPAVEAGLKIDF